MALNKVFNFQFYREKGVDKTKENEKNWKKKIWGGGTHLPDILPMRKGGNCQWTAEGGGGG